MYCILCLFTILGAQCTYSDADSSCQSIRKPMCPVPTAVERITVTVNGKKLTTVSKEFSPIYDYAYYYDPSESLQVNCSVAEAHEAYLSMCGHLMQDEYAVCVVGETCSKLKTFRLGAGYTKHILYCYTVVYYPAVQTVARLTLHYNNSKIGDGTTNAIDSTDFEKVIPLPSVQSENDTEERGHETGANSHKASAASGFGLYVYGFYALTALCVLMIIIALIMAIRTICAHKEKKDNVTIDNPERHAQDACASERYVENELYVSCGPSHEYSVPCVNAPREPRKQLNKQPETTCIYMNADRINK